MHKKLIQEYAFQDALGSLRALFFLTLFLAVCLVAPNLSGIIIDYHLGTLLLQSALLGLFLKLPRLQTRRFVVAMFVIITVSTLHESYVWVSQLDGDIRGAKTLSKGAWAAYLLESPPYLYPILRIGLLGLFVPIFRTFGGAKS